MNTDQIAPVLQSRGLKDDYKTMLFYRARRRDDGSENRTSCSTSRNSASRDSGDRPQFRRRLVARVRGVEHDSPTTSASSWRKSFADIYRENCLQNGVLPVVLAPRRRRCFHRARGRCRWRGAVHRRSGKPAHQRAGRPRCRHLKFRRPTACGCSKDSTTSGMTLKHMDDIVSLGKARCRGAAVDTDRAGRAADSKGETRHERAKEIQGHHGGQAPGADARRL